MTIIVGEFDCGCIGFAPEEETEEVNVHGNPYKAKMAWLMEVCDSDGYDPSPNLFRRNMLGKEWAPLTKGQSDKHLKLLGDLTRDGHRFRTIKRLLDSESYDGH